MLSKSTILPLLLATSGTLAAPSPRAAPAEIQPTTAVLHDGHWSGQNTCNPSPLQVTKTSTGHDLSTMLTFTYPAGVAGKQCWLDFLVPTTATVTPAGNAKIDVFRQWAPVTSCPSQGNNRDRQLGRWSLAGGVGKAATWEVTYSPYLTTKQACPAPGTVEGVELVGVGDAENVAWRQAVGTGVRILYA